MEGRLVNYEQSPDSPDEALNEEKSTDYSPIVDPNSVSFSSSKTPMISGVSDDILSTAVPFHMDDSSIVAFNKNPDIKVADKLPPPTHSDSSVSAALKLISRVPLTEEKKQKIAKLQLCAGNDPDAAEFECLVLPEQGTVNAELNHLNRKVLFVSSLTMEEFTHQNVLEVMAHCKQFKVAFVQQPEATPMQSFWEGCMAFQMHTTSDAKEANLHLRNIRSDLNVRTLGTDENVFDVMERWCNCAAALPRCSILTDRLLIVNNLAPGTTEAKLQHLFSDALDVLLSTRENPDKCFAYLIYGSRSKMEEAYTKYTSKSVDYDGRVLRVLKYEAPKNIPEAFLRLEERFKVLKLLERFVTAQDLARNSPQPLQHSIKQAVAYLSTLVKSDSKARQSLGLPVFNLEELHELLAISRSLDTVDEPPFTKLFSTLNSTQEKLKESKNARRFFLSSIGETGTNIMKSKFNSERKPETLTVNANLDANSTEVKDGNQISQARQSAGQSLSRKDPRSSITRQPLPPREESMALNSKRWARYADHDARHRHLRHASSSSPYLYPRRITQFRTSSSQRLSSYCTKMQSHGLRDSRSKASRSRHVHH